MQRQLTEWHKSAAERLSIDTSEMRRKRAGLDGAVHFVPGIFNDKLKFRSIEEATAQMIKMQSDESVHKYDTTDLYAEDVHLIYKDDKIYYFPGEYV